MGLHVQPLCTLSGHFNFSMETLNMGFHCKRGLPMRSTCWGVIYVVVVAAFSLVYFLFWLAKPDSFIINSELNVHPFYDMDRLMWGDENYDYKVGSRISLIELKEENDKYFLELSNSQDNLKTIEIEMLEIRDELEKLSEIRNSEIDNNTEAFDSKKLTPFVLKEKNIQAELAKLEKELPQTAKTQEDIELIRRVGDKRVELARIRVEKAHQAYLNSEFMLNNLSSFMTQETRDRYAELNQRETDNYEERFQIESRMRDARSITLDKVEKHIKDYRNKLNIVDFFYFSVGISTTTTFGDIVANDRLVRGVVSFQLIICIFIIGGFVNSVIVREASKSSKSDAAVS
tara:strand:+ start:9765 stop:10799 length:1035 start_codon:yes stop_codon:yes gene_type:complete